VPVVIKTIQAASVLNAHDRFWRKVRKGSDCWEWTAYKSPYGYGKFRVNGESRCAHRIAYTIVIGEIPDGMCVCHTCDNRACVNPAHLWLGTYADNHQDMVSKGKKARNASFGETNGNAKLTKEQVLAIRTASGLQRIIAKQFGVTQTVISRIKLRRAWSHL